MSVRSLESPISSDASRRCCQRRCTYRRLFDALVAQLEPATGQCGIPSVGRQSTRPLRQEHIETSIVPDKQRQHNPCASVCGDVGSYGGIECFGEARGILA